MVHMGRARLGAGLAIAALLLGGCGAVSPGGSADPTSATATATAASSTSVAPRVGGGGDDALSAPYGPAFPLTLRRTGGMAGFDDRVVLDLDGRVHVETRSVHGRVCTLGAPQLHQLLALLATLRLGPHVSDDLPSGVAPPGEAGAVTPDPVSDPITVSVTDHEARRIDLSDPSLGEVSGLVGTLVSDVTLSVPATTRCTTSPESAVAPAP